MRIIHTVLRRCPRLLLGAALLGCGTGDGGGSAKPDAGVSPPADGALTINEVMSQNEGAWIDERGETHDWVELVNRGSQRVRLSDHWLADGSGQRVRLSGPDLQPGQRRLFWADGDASGGEGHLPFQLKSSGDRLVLSDALERVSEEVEVPELAPNTVLARYPDGTGPHVVCRYASPSADNGPGCVPPEPPSLTDDVQFEPSALEPDYPPARAGVVLSELALRPAAGGQAFVELYNRGASSVALDELSLSLATHAPHLPWPGPLDGSALELPASAVLAPGARLVIDVGAGALAPLQADPSFEGVLTLWDRDSGESVERVDFMSWPLGSSLMQNPGRASYRYCTNTTPGAEDDCDPLASRPVGERLRHLRTPGDYAALAEGGDELGIRSVKFVVDLSAPGLVHLLSAASWPLHYTFVRERVYREPVLDRCDPAQNSEFYQGWSAFSATEYFQVEGRRFLLGTLTHHSGADLHSVEYATGDVISGEQMRQGFLSAVAHSDAPGAWALRPQDDSQVERARSIEGQIPLVGPNAPFEGVTYQPLSEGVAYGTLRFVPASELESAALGPDVILVTDDVPNDIPLVGGLVTEAFQTPLAHVNVLSQNRGTPNASLKDARTALAASLEQLVRLEVAAGGLAVTAAEPEEAQAFWDSRAPAGPR
ncbi:MAG TPA: lamin tail domain-containing protein, partial [Polyangiaceae bacterium]|nr:lamin tail domain-containing protein [Polyangiaceae bacterium]